MTIRQIRALTSLTRKEFCEQYNLNEVTVAKWESKNPKVAPYILELLEFKVRYDTNFLNEDSKLKVYTFEEYYLRGSAKAQYTVTARNVKTAIRDFESSHPDVQNYRLMNIR